MKHLRAWLLLLALAPVVAVWGAGCGAGPGEDEVANPVIARMLSWVSEDNIRDSTLALEEFGTRAYPASGFTRGNEEAAAWIYSQLEAVPGLEVEYQSAHRNVIATLPGDSMVFIVGAHYDCMPETGPAPGASDNGVGVAMVLEMARVMAQHEFRHTVVFAFWNGEERGHLGSRAYVAEMAAGGVHLRFFHNIDSAAYDPDEEYSLDIISNTESTWVARLFVRQNDLYRTGFSLTRNRHHCGSDHKSFWEGGYTATTTHSNGGDHNGHSPAAHTADDRLTPGNVSIPYASRHCQLTMAVLAESAECISPAGEAGAGPAP